ncbi:DUF3592 domain-containing protein [Thermostilla marina]
MSTHSDSRSALPLVLGFTAFVFGFFYLPWATWNLWRAAACAGWIETAGTVISTEVREKQHSGGVDYEPVVVYRYEVDGQAYESSRFAYSASPFNRTKAEAEQIAAKYPPGAVVTVYHHPSRPEEAVLRRDVTGSNYGAVGLSLLALLVGTGLIYWGTRTRNRGRRSATTA